MSARVIVVAGVASGVGKTSITLGLLAALRRRGLTVQSFKVGPDFIDPGLHARVTARPAYNLDGWMCGRARVLEAAARGARDADVAVVEGVMGCFDGVDGASEEGSTAQVARWLGAPVVLVLDAGALADNAAIRKAVRRFAEAGRPIYAECGGLMFLADSLEDLSGRVHPMVGVLPAAVRMREHGLTLGYAEVTLTGDCLLGGAGDVVRGQEFHASTLGPVPASVPRLYRVRAPGGGERAEGYQIGRTLMSYLHLHWASRPECAPAFVAACAGSR